MKFFKPFENLNFSKDHCFLCGKSLVESFENLKELSVFPIWFIKQIGLRGKPFRMLNESYKNYEDLRMPCCFECQEYRINPLDNEVNQAFRKGYSGMKDLNSHTLFLWVSRVMYGIIFLEIQLALEDHEKENRFESTPLGISPSLIIKFGQVHLFLQGLRVAMVWENFIPFSIWMVKLAEPEKHELWGGVENIPFEYRDDMSTLIFSLTAMDFGFVMCLQDNGMNQLYNKSIFNNWEGKSMTFKQFQEFRARVFYSAYLFIPIPNYLVLPPVNLQNEYTLEAQPLPPLGSSLFKPWQNKIYAQVLEAFWKPWGISKSEILNDPEHPLSVLTKSK